MVVQEYKDTMKKRTFEVSLLTVTTLPESAVRGTNWRYVKHLFKAQRRRCHSNGAAF